MSDRPRPYRVSALHAFHLANDAIMGEIAEWRIARRYGEEGSVTVAATACAMVDISPIPTLEILGPNLDSWIASSLGLRDPIAVGETRQVADGAIARLRADRAWKRGPHAVIAEPDDPDVDGPPPKGLRVADCSHGLTGIGLLGPGAPEVLSMRAMSPSSVGWFPDGTVIQTGVAGVPAVILEFTIARRPVYHVLVARHHGLYVWEQFVPAVRRLGGAIAGWDTWCASVTPPPSQPAQTRTGDI